MPPILIENPRSRVRVTPELGAGLLEWSIRAPDGAWTPVLRPTPHGASHFNDLAMYLLCPWSNRVRGGAFRFRGSPITLRADWPDGTAIHGAVKDRGFSILDRSPISARLEFRSRGRRDANFPWAFTCRARYQLNDLTLRVRVEVDNDSAEPMPAGLGAHPFFARRLWGDDDPVLRADLSGRYPAREMIPTGPARRDDLVDRLRAGTPLAPLELDDVFRGSLDGASLTWPASRVRARFACSNELGHAVVYTGRARDGVPWPYACVEPVSMVNDGFNRLAEGDPGTGVAELAPGGTLGIELSITIEAA